MSSNFTQEFLALCSRTSNSTSELWLVADKVTGQVSAAFLLLILVVGLPWNLLVVLTIVKEKLYHQPTIILLLNLTVNDLVCLIIFFPMDLVTGFSGEFVLGSDDFTRCQVCRVGVLNITFILMSVYTISLMAFDRFLFIYKPLHYSRILTNCRMIVAVSVMWILILLLSILGFNRVVFQPYFGSCQLDYTFTSGYYLILVYALFCVPVLALVVFNVWVIVIAQKNIRAIYGTRKLPDRAGSHEHDEVSTMMTKKRREKECHLIRVFGGLLCSNLVTWLPYIALSFYIFATMPQVEFPAPLAGAAKVLFLLQLVLHPMVETALIKDVREPLLEMTGFRKCSRMSGLNDSLGTCVHSHERRCECGCLALVQSSFMLGFNSQSTTTPLQSEGGNTCPLHGGDQVSNTVSQFQSS